MACRATSANGSPCMATPIRASGYCYWHCPTLEGERAAARRRGGQSRSNKSRARRQYAEGALTPTEVEGLLGTSMRAVIAGRMTPGQGSAVAALARAAMHVREAGELESRIAELEAASGVRGGKTA